MEYPTITTLDEKGHILDDLSGLGSVWLILLDMPPVCFPAINFVRFDTFPEHLAYTNVLLCEMSELFLKNNLAKIKYY